jgi:RNA polymerase sigma-70 factor (ECF subfamily)
VTPGFQMSDEGDSGRPALRVVTGGAAGAQAGAASRDLADANDLRAFLAGENAAFGALVRRHEPLVLALVRRYARTQEDARDLAQRTFLRAFEAVRRSHTWHVRQHVPFRRWLVRVAVNLARNHLRDETRWTRAPLEALEATGATPAAAPEALERAEREVKVRRAVLRLPGRQREVLTLRIDADLPFAEIAAALGITENAAKVSFHHAVRRLRELVGEEDRS